MSHNIAGQWYRHSETNKEKEREIKRRTYKRKFKETDVAIHLQSVTIIIAEQ